jgi:hypothetical protein
MTPSQAIVRESVRPLTVTDGKGRQLILRRLTALDTLRLFKAAGPILAQNEPWLSMAGLAFSLLEVDGIPVPPPATESQIESLIDRLGDEGLKAIADAIKDQHEDPDPKSNVGNLLGTQS